MKEIDVLYRELVALRGSSGMSRKTAAAVRSNLLRRIATEVESLIKQQPDQPFDSEQYLHIDREIRERILMEIQIILDEYTLAVRNNELAKWEAMYGDIQYYQRNFYYFRFSSRDKKGYRGLTDYHFINPN